MNQVETIGADLGGTKLAVGVVGDGPEAVFASEVSSRGYSQEEVIDLLADQIREAREARPAAVAAGVGIPATLDFESGHAISTVNLDLVDLPVRELLSERIGLPTVIDNDANLAMLAEALYGAARGADYALMLTLGTGIGGGIWIGGELFRGAHGAGAELGHVVVEIDGPRCQGNCPGYGCVETFASGTAIGRQGREAAEREPDSALGLLAAAGSGITAREVASAARGGDRAATGVIEKAGHYLGTALVSLVNIFEPEVIVLGGGVMRMGDLLLEPVRQELRRRALPPMNRTEVVEAEFGPEAGVIGAAALARIELEKEG